MNHRNIISAAVAAALGAGSVAAEPLGGLSPADAEPVAKAWFIQFASPPGQSRQQQQAMAEERAAFSKQARSAGIDYTGRRDFTLLWNGISVQASASAAQRLKGLPGVAAVFPVVQVSQPEPRSGSLPNLITAVSMTGADIAQSQLGLSGAGVKVGVIDTGVDIDHPDLGGSGNPGDAGAAFPTERIAYGWDFVGDDYNANPSDPAYNPVPQPDSNPDDCGGHGTHVAGIVGANGDVIGVAPGVTLGAYRVFGCNGSTDSDIIVAAMERAYLDGMDVVNMSLGSSFSWPQYPTSVAASALVDQGVVVVASIGNSGASGLYAASSPGLGENVIGVASVDNTYVLSAYFEVMGEKVAYLPMAHAGPVPESGMEDYVWIGRACLANGDDILVDDPLVNDPAGKTALIVRGACNFSEKASRAIDAGATAVVIANNASGNFAGTLGAPIDGTTPVVSVSGESGEFMLQAAEQQLSWSDQTFLDANPTGGLISNFSSYGLSPDLTLKPDLAAPGGAIYSTYPLEQGAYATLGGTSMSSPHVAGAVALVLEAKPGIPAAEMRPLLQNSADPSFFTLNPGLGFYEPVHRQGAGTIDIDAAAQSEVLITPGKISLGEGESGVQVHVLTIRNDGQEAVTYDLYEDPALWTSGLTDDIGWWPWWYGGPLLSFDQAQVTVAAGASATVTVTVVPAVYPDPALGGPFLANDYGIYGGYILFWPSGDAGEPLRVPYAGFVGDYQRIQHIGPGAFGILPLMARVEGEQYVFGGYDDEANWTFSMAGGDIAHFLFHFDHQLAYLEATVYSADTGEPAHPYYATVLSDQLLPRNAADDSFFDIEWDGTRAHGSGDIGPGYTQDLRRPLPDGRYYLEFRGLKANGDAAKPEHWESWTSPVLVIERPDPGRP